MEEGIEEQKQFNLEVVNSSQRLIDLTLNTLEPQMANFGSFSLKELHALSEKNDLIEYAQHLVMNGHPIPTTGDLVDLGQLKKDRNYRNERDSLATAPRKPRYEYGHTEMPVTEEGRAAYLIASFLQDDLKQHLATMIGDKELAESDTLPRKLEEQRPEFVIRLKGDIKKIQEELPIFKSALGLMKSGAKVPLKNRHDKSGSGKPSDWMIDLDKVAGKETT
ncbi:hypothetical protein HY384_03605 [Candidatus Daviesbacteria bacterium]|nr:hypothetical protein [Candidatus Daviesbacteria bacterium]